jgi:hypothetical protein
MEAAYVMSDLLNGTLDTIAQISTLPIACNVDTALMRGEMVSEKDAFSTRTPGTVAPSSRRTTTACCKPV